MATTKCMLLILPYIIGVARCSQVAVIVLEQSLACYGTSVSEGGNVTACATIVYTYGDLPLTRNISVLFTTSDGSALSPKDYGAISETRVFAVGSVEQQKVCVTIPTVDETVVEYDEYFQVTLSTNESNVTIGDRAGGVRFTVTVYDNDVATVAFPENFTMFYTWENSSSLHLCIQLIHGELEKPVSAGLFFNSVTASVGIDTWYYYVDIGFYIGSPIGSLSCIDAVSIVNDNHVENDEDFTINIGGDYYTIAPYNNTAKVTILDDEVALISLQSNNPTSTPETDITLSVCISLTNAVVLDISINVYFEAISGTATRGKDFVQTESGNFVFSPGYSSACIHVKIIQDTILEYNEFMFFSTSCNSSHALCTAGNGSVEIIEDADTVTVGLLNDNFTGIEGGSMPLNICAVMVNGILERLIPVYITTHIHGASSTAGMDYIPLVEAVVMFTYGATASNATSSCIALTVINDNILENTESLSVSVATALPYVLISSTKIFASVYILEDPSDYIEVGFSRDAPNIVTEGVNLNLQLCPKILNGSLERDVTVYVSTRNITAKSPVDYELVTTQVKFTYGQSFGDSVCFIVIINNDANVLEYTEQFEVVLTEHYNVTLVHFPPQQGSIVVTIIEDPNDGINIGFISSSYQCDETVGNFTVCVIMFSGTLEKNVSVAISSVDGSAEAYSDYSPLISTLTFTSGMMSGNSVCKYTFVIDDTEVEQDVETYNLTLTATEPVVTKISLAVSTISIYERKNDVVIIGLKQSTYVGVEGSNVVICAEILHGAIERTVSVFLSAISGTAIEGADFVGVRSVELRMPMHSGINTTACTDVMIINDTDIESEEQFTLILETVDPAVNITVKIATVLISTDPHDVAIFGMKQSVITVTEGSNYSFPICVTLESLTGNLTLAISLRLMAQDIPPAHVGQDYYMETNVVMFSAQSQPEVTSVCTAVFIINDNNLENTEQFYVLLLSNDTGVIIDKQKSRTIIKIMEESTDSITVGFGAVHSYINETQEQVKICINLITGALERNVSVHLMTISNTASSDHDFIGVKENITLSEGLSTFHDDKICINITIIDDDVLEYPEDFQVMLLSTIEDQHVVLIPAILSVVLVTIIEDQHDVIKVGFEHSSYSASEVNGSVVVCAAIYMGTLERRVAVLLVTSSDASSTDAATPGLDFTSVRATVEFIPGQSQFSNRTQCIRIEIIDDGISETVEGFMVSLEKVPVDGDVVEFANVWNNASVYILDNNGYVFQFVNTSYMVLEGSPVTICVEVIKYPPSNQMQLIPVVLITKSITATDGQDYDNSTHAILFYVQSQNGIVVPLIKCTSIQTIADHTVEEDETFGVNLLYILPSSSSVLNRGAAVVTIHQGLSDYAVGRFADISLAALAGESIAACVQLEDATGNIERYLNYSISILTGADFKGKYFLLEGSENDSFSAGSAIGSIKCLAIQLLNVSSANVNFSLLLASSDPVLKIIQDFSVLSIRILHTPWQVPRVSMAAKFLVVAEELQNIQLCAVIVRGTMTHGAVFNLLTLSNTATEVLDFVFGNYTIVFQENDMTGSTHCVTVYIIDDYLLESNETFYAVLTSTDDDIVTVSPTVTSVIIQDDRGKVIEIGFKKKNYTISEAPNSHISICCDILRTNLTLARPLEIGIVTVRNLTNASRYSLPSVFEFSNGETENSSQCINVTILDDNIVEYEEKLVLTLVSLDPNVPVVVDRDHNVTTLYIEEDPNDFIEIQWERQQYVAYEGKDLEMCAKISSGGLGRDVVVMMNTSLNTASLADLYLPPTTLTFKSGQSTASTSCFVVHINDDTIVEADEAFSIQLISSSVVHTSPNNTTTYVTILSDPSDVITVGWSQEVYNSTEGKDLVVIICAEILNGTLEVGVSIAIQHSRGTAIKGSDFAIASWYMEFSSGQSQYNQSTSCVKVFIINDTVVEDTESFILQLSPTNQSSCISSKKKDVNIAIYEDRRDFVILSWQSNTYTTREASGGVKLQVCIVIEAGSLERDISVNIFTTDISATYGNDYTLGSTVAVLMSGQNQSHSSIKCLSVTILDDDVLEYNKSFALSLVLAHPAIQGAIINTTVIIMEDTSDYVEVGFAQLLYEVDQDLLFMPLPIDVKLVRGNLQRNVSLVLDLRSNATTTTAATSAAEVLYSANATFTFGETSGAVRHEMLNISSLSAVSGINFASVTLTPTPEDKDVIRFVNNQALIKIAVQDSSVSPLPAIFGSTSLILALVCATLLIITALTLYYKSKRAKKTAPAIPEQAPARRTAVVDNISVEELI